MQPNPPAVSPVSVLPPQAGPAQVAGFLEDAELIRKLFEKYPFLFQGQQDARDHRTVAEVVGMYLKDATGDLEPKAFEHRERQLKAFVEEFGPRRVTEPTPFELKVWIFARYPGSPWTRHGVNIGVQRVFNWAVRMRVIRENPVRGLQLNEMKQVGRNMTLDEFRLLLSKTDPAFRRFMMGLYLTGCRPGELRLIKWENIDWQRGVAVLAHHKTFRKTGKPRQIVFAPAGMKLLAYIKRHWHEPAAAELKRLLEQAPGRQMRVRDVCARMHALGFSDRALYRAREAIGATYERVGGWREHGYVVYTLPENAKSEPTHESPYVFLCSKHRPWKKEALGTKFSRLRKECKLPMDCKLYGLRHLYITEAVKRGVNLKALATLVGHATTVMIERTYCHLDNDVEFLQAAALQAIGGTRSAPVAEPVTGSAFAPGNGEPTPGGKFDDPVLALMLKRLLELEEKLKNAPPTPPALPRNRVLQDCHRIAYDAYKWALTQEPTLATATDTAVYRWLAERPEYQGQLPPHPVTFRRYLNQARVVLEGAGRRRGRRKKFTPPA